jgi:hypothetical protein
VSIEEEDRLKRIVLAIIGDAGARIINPFVVVDLPPDRQEDAPRIIARLQRIGLQPYIAFDEEDAERALAEITMKRAS